MKVIRLLVKQKSTKYQSGIFIVGGMRESTSAVFLLSCVVVLPTICREYGDDDGIYSNSRVEAWNEES